MESRSRSELDELISESCRVLLWGGSELDELISEGCRMLLWGGSELDELISYGLGRREVPELLFFYLVLVFRRRRYPLPGGVGVGFKF